MELNHAAKETGVFNSSDNNSLSTNLLLIMLAILIGMVFYLSESKDSLIIYPAMALVTPFLSVLQAALKFILTPYFFISLVVYFGFLSSQTKENIKKEVSLAWNKYSTYLYLGLCVLMSYQLGYLHYISMPLDALHPPWAGLTLSYVNDWVYTLFHFAAFNTAFYLAIKYMVDSRHKFSNKGYFSIMLVGCLFLISIAEYAMHIADNKEFIFFNVYLRIIEVIAVMLMVGSLFKIKDFVYNPLFKCIMAWGLLIGLFGMGEIGSYIRIYNPTITFMANDSQYSHNIGRFGDTTLFISKNKKILFKCQGNNSHVSSLDGCFCTNINKKTGSHTGWYQCNNASDFKKHIKKYNGV